MLHYSPEPRVIERLIDSAHLAGREDLVDLHRRQLVRVYGQGNGRNNPVAR